MLLHFALIEIGDRIPHPPEANAKPGMFFDESCAPCLGGGEPLLPTASAPIDPRMKSAWLFFGDGPSMRSGSRDCIVIFVDTHAQMLSVTLCCSESCSRRRA